MVIDFTDAELDLIYDALTEIRVTTDNEDVVFLIESIYDKIFEADKND